MTELSAACLRRNQDHVTSHNLILDNYCNIWDGQ